MQIKNELFLATVVVDNVVDVVLSAICCDNGFVVGIVVAVVVDNVAGDVVSVTFNSVALVVGFRGVIFKVSIELDIPSTDKDFKFSAFLFATSMIASILTSF